MKKKNYWIRFSVLLVLIRFFSMAPVSAKWIMNPSLGQDATLNISGITNDESKRVAYIEGDTDELGFTTIEAALAKATQKGGSQKVVVVPGMDPVIQHNCVISNGVELILPYYKSDTDTTLVLEFVDETKQASSASLKSKFDSSLILDPSVSLTIESGGIFTVNATVGAYGGNPTTGASTGYTYGHYSEVKRAEKSSIVVKSGGKLNCWGFIREVRKQSSTKFPYITDLAGNEANIYVDGGEICEPFVLYDWQGGSKSLAIAVGSNDTSTKGLAGAALSFKGANIATGFKKVREVFPMHKFDMPNIFPKVSCFNSGKIQGRLSLYMGSSEKVVTAIKPIVASDGLISYSSGTCVWDYVIDSTAQTLAPSIANHKTKLAMNGFKDQNGNITRGKASIGNLSVQLIITVGVDFNETINTSDFFLPIGEQFDIEIEDSEFTFNQKTMFLPGSSLIIGSKGSCSVTSDFAAFYSDNNGLTSDSTVINKGILKFQCDKGKSWGKTTYSGSFGAKVKGNFSSSGSDSSPDYNNHSISLKSNVRGSVADYKFVLQQI